MRPIKARSFLTCGLAWILPIAAAMAVAPLNARSEALVPPSVSLFATIVARDVAASSSTPWKQLIAHIEKTGTGGQSMDGDSITLTRVTPNDLTKTHQMDYFSVIGEASSSSFAVEEVDETSEAWDLQADGSWKIDQWIYVLSPTGQLEQIHHSQAAEDASGDITDDHYFPSASPTDPAIIAQWGKKLAEWSSTL